jgi:DNA-binding transcriptional ArsR family regulator/catechol 2,3-dioxygenase-like lactoylglutathione lyase family enzyme
VADTPGSDALFRALADPTRRIVLDELAQRDGQSLFEICARLAMRHGIGSSRQAISQHLALLEQAGLVRTERAGRTKLHHLTTEPVREIAQRWTHPKGHLMLRINVTSVFVDDQAKALAFYTDKLGFLPGYDMPAGGARWLTVRDGHSDVELLLEPNGHPAAQTYQKALVADGIPCTQFAVDNVQVAYDELSRRGVIFTQPPTVMGPATTAILDDTCGNLIQIVAMNGTPG